MTSARTEGSEIAYEIRLSGPGIKIDKHIDQSTAFAVLQMVFGGAGGAEGPTAASAPHDRSSQPRQQPPLSVREFLESSRAKTNSERIATFGAFLRDHQKQQDFTREDIRVSFKNAGEPLPGNLARDFQATLQEGWIAEDHQNSGRYYVTRKGDELISRNFGNEPKTK